MKFLLSILLLFVVGVYSHEGASHVVPLDSSNFDSTIAAHELSLVEFFAPWCGHCKALAPKFEEAAHQLEGVALLASVDCTVERDLCGKYGVRGFPTLKVFRNDGNEPTEYNAGREVRDIVNFMKKQGQPAYRVVAASEVESLVEGVTVVGHFATEADAATFLGVARVLRNEYNFLLVTGAATPSVAVHKEDGVATLSEDLTETTIQTFIASEAFPLVGEIGPESYQKYVERGFPLVWIFVDLNAAETENVLKAAAEAAADFKGKLSVVKLDGVRWAEHAKHFGLSGSLPGIVIEDRDNNKNYVFNEKSDVTAATLRSHMQGFLDKSLEPTVKSEEVPATQDGPVYVLVGKTFDEVVNNPEKDVFVEFYAPWCGHCKSLAPKYDELGLKFKEDPHTLIAKIDATANDTPADIKGFPTLYLYKAGDKKNPVQYQGERTTEAMEAWLKTQSSFGGADSHDEL